jgi:hypothetical protein
MQGSGGSCAGPSVQSLIDGVAASSAGEKNDLRSRMKKLGIESKWKTSSVPCTAASLIVRNFEGG